MKKATVHYALYLLEDRKLIDSSYERNEPFTFSLGEKEVIPGFEKAVLSLKIGEKREFCLGPDEGYGPVLPFLLQRVERSHFSKELPLSVGIWLNIHNERVLVKELDENSVLLDRNHPLAGQHLLFEIELLERSD